LFDGAHGSSRRDVHAGDFAVADAQDDGHRVAANFAVGDELRAAFGRIERQVEFFTTIGADNVYSL